MEQTLFAEQHALPRANVRCLWFQVSPSKAEDQMFPAPGQLTRTLTKSGACHMASWVGPGANRPHVGTPPSTFHRPTHRHPTNPANVRPEPGRVPGEASGLRGATDIARPVPMRPRRVNSKDQNTRVLVQKRAKWPTICRFGSIPEVAQMTHVLLCYSPGLSVCPKELPQCGRLSWTKLVGRREGRHRFQRSAGLPAELARRARGPQFSGKGQRKSCKLGTFCDILL